MTELVRPWCAEWKNRETGSRFTCVLASQPAKREPEYRDSMRTLCRHYVMLTTNIARGVPTCPDCVRILAHREAHR